MFDWDAFVLRLKKYPPHYHQLLPPCPPDRIEAVERELGQLPVALRDMVSHFNGGELFLSAGPTFSLFRISTFPPLPPFEWAPEWCIDVLTPRWRTAGINRSYDWAMGITNYGGLILLDDKENVKEWDTSQGSWLVKNLPLGDWIEKIISEGETVMAETS
jgi:hypothetical protein